MVLKLPRFAVFLLLASLVACSDSSEPASNSPDSPDAKDRPAANAAADSRKPTDAPAANATKLPPPPAGSRLGDAGLTPVSHAEAEHYPRLAAWALAGVRGGIPKPAAQPSATVSVGSDIQAALDAVGKGIVELAPGMHEIDQTLRVPAGVTLRGSAEAGGSTLRHGSTQASNVAILLENVERAGVERLTLEHADPQDFAQRDHHGHPTVYADAPGFSPTSHAAIEVLRTRDVWLSDITVTVALTHPLRIEHASHCTVRNFTVRDVLNRGTQSGSLRLHDCNHLLLIGLRLQGLRKVELAGPVTDSVLRAGVLGCGIYLRNADAVAGNLFEDLHLLFRPGHLFMPLSKDAQPVGPDNLLINCTTVYHHGTDTLAPGIVAKPAEPYRINTYSNRVSLDPVTGATENHRLVDRYTYTRTLNVAAGGVKPAVIPAVFDAPPDGIPVRNLRNEAILDDWVHTADLAPGSTTEKAPDLDALVKNPLKPGETRDILGQTVAIFDHITPPDRMDPANMQQMVGRFGQQGIPAGGSAVSVLKMADNNWTGSVILQRLLHIPGPLAPTVQLKQRAVGLDAQVFLGSTLVEENTSYQLQPGYHLITVFAKLNRQIDLIKDGTFELRCMLQPQPGPVTREREVPGPAVGFLHPYHVAIDPLAGERKALAAWRGYFTKLRAFPYPNRLSDTTAFIGAHPGTHVAWVLKAIHDVLEQAPLSEEADLTPVQWGELVDYYERQGMPERKWAIGKANKVERFMDYYPTVMD